MKLFFLLFFPFALIGQMIPFFDNTFSEDGRLTTSIWNNNFARCVAVQPDNKILVAGNMSRISPNMQSYFVIRYNEDGSIDTTFGTDGFLYEEDNNGEWVLKMLVQPDGKILITGLRYIARLMPDGTLDNSFGDNGTSYFENVSGFNRDMHLLEDGSILVYGSRGISNQLKSRIVKFKSNGDVDASFGDDGQVIQDFGYPTLINNSMVVQADGKIITGGAAVPNPSYPQMNMLLLVRYNPDGSLDTTFGDNGIVLDNSVTLEARDIALDSNQNIVVVGEKDIVFAGTGTYGNSVILRFNNDGSRDQGFNSTGYNIVDIHNYADYASAVLVDRNDKIYFTGHYYGGTGTSWRRYVARFNSDGSFDNTFGEDGIFLSQVPNYTGESLYGNNNMVLTDNGKLVIGGYINGYLSNNITVFRLMLEDALTTVNEEAYAIHIFPNPTNDIVNIQSHKEVGIIELYDLTGKKVADFSNSKQFKIAHLKSGVYVVKIIMKDGKKHIQKVIKR